MPFKQLGDAAYALFGTYNDVAGNQYVTYNQPMTSDSRLQEIWKTLKRLDPADMDATHREECLDGTRTEITQFVFEWAHNGRVKEGQTVLLLHGVAGSGKSTIATTIANRFSALGCLGAFLFFERDVAIRSDPSTVIRTMAYKLGMSHEKFGEAIAANVKKYPEIIHFPLRAQFQHLLVGPMTSTGVVNPASPIVFVLDALDECGNAETRKVLLELLAEQSNKLPALFAITTRPLQDVSGFFEGRDHVLLKDLDITTQQNKDDILTFLAHNMKRIRNKYPTLRRRNEWPGDEMVLRLANRASGLFIWASTACKFIDQHPADDRLQIVIQGTSASTADDIIDVLYRTALEAAGSWDNPQFVSDFRAVLGFILVARRPLAADEIISLLGNSFVCIDVLCQLGCVIQLNPKARLLHPSLADFLYHPQRCGRSDWLFDEPMLHHSLSQICIKHLDAILKENLCDIVLSPTLVHVGVSDDIAYACIHWVDHTCMASEPATILPLIELFIHRHLLHWVEAMSILKTSRNTTGILKRLYAWLSIQSGIADTFLNLVNDGVRFVQRHADLIERHPLLVYASALPFTPTGTLLYKTFHDSLLHPSSWGRKEKSWSSLLQLMFGHRSVVQSVVISSDGTQIVSGSDDKTVRVWDAISGMEILPAMKGHEDNVRSAAFSPNGTRIVSGSWDSTVRLWDASSGVMLLPPMRGHTDCVNSVAFSLDGQLIISGSEDKTVRIWDANSGSEVGRPLKGHSKMVTSVSCSQNRIASGSYDKTIRVWDIASEIKSLLPLQGHTSQISSVVFSPDGTHIASGSWDKTIRLWDSITGIQILPPFIGHSGRVQSVAFSPDGTRIVSGSDDKTIRQWDVTTGKEVMPSLVYSHCITSVSFSPDGTRIVSGSYDSTVQIWDATSTSELNLVSEGHTENVKSVAFSPDGTRLVTGSHDNTIRVWDTTSGVQIARPLIGHKFWVCSVAFSADGARIVSGSRDNTVRVWDVTTGLAALPPMYGHDGTVFSVSFCPFGTRIASGSVDKTVRVWNATTGLELLPPLQHNKSVMEVSFSSDGYYIVSRDGHEQTYVWDAMSGTLISDEEDAEPMPPGRVIGFDGDSGWIMDQIINRHLSALPISIDDFSYAIHGKTLAVGTSSGEVFFMRFPTIC